MRLTKYEPSNESMFPYRLKDEELSTELDSIHKLGQLEDIEEELGVDLVEFLTECKYVLKNANHTIGYTSKGIEIKTDFGYVDQFIDEMKKALKKED